MRLLAGLFRFFVVFPIFGLYVALAWIWAQLRTLWDAAYD